MADSTLSAEEQKYLNEQYVAETKKFYDVFPTTEPAKTRDREELIAKYESGEINADVNSLLNLKYNNRRLVNYPETKIPDFDNILQDNTKAMDVKEESQWNFRLPKNRKTRGWSSDDETKERLVVNAKPDSKLIEEMDKFCAKYKCYYKTPDSAGWNERVDTLVVYSKENISPEMQAEFIALITPFIRNDIPEKTNALDGEKIGEGIFKAKEKTHDDIKAFLGELRAKLPGHIVDGIEANINKTNPDKWKWSLGQFATAEEFIKDYLEKFPQKTVLHDEELTDDNKITEEERAFHREQWESIAERDGLTYVEDKDANVFKAVLKDKTTGDSLDVEASGDKIYFSARDKDGNRKVPDHKYFEDVVAQVRAKGHVLKLADNIQGPEKAEFKARLIIACLKASPPMYITNLTEVNGPLEEETKTELARLLKERNKKLGLEEEDSKEVGDGEKDDKEGEDDKEKEKPEPEKETITTPEIEKIKERLTELGKIDEADRNDFQKAEINFHGRTIEDLEIQYLYEEKSEKTGEFKPGWNTKFRLGVDQSEDGRKAAEKFMGELEDYFKSINLGYTKTKLINRDSGAEEAVDFKLYAGSIDNRNKVVNDLNRLYKERGLGAFKSDNAVSLSEGPHQSNLLVSPFDKLSDKTKNTLLKAGVDKGILDSGTKYPAGDNEDLASRFKLQALEAYVTHKHLMSKAGEGVYYKDEADKNALNDQLIKITGVPSPGKMAVWDNISKTFSRAVDMNDRDVNAEIMKLKTAEKLDFNKSVLKLKTGSSTKTGGRP